MGAFLDGPAHSKCLEIAKNVGGRNVRFWPKSRIWKSKNSCVSLGVAPIANKQVVFRVKIMSLQSVTVNAWQHFLYHWGTFLYLEYQNNQIDLANNISSFVYYSLSAMVPENRCCMSGLWDLTVRKRFNLIRKYYVFADILCRRSLWKASIQIFPLMIDQPLTPPTHLRAVWRHQQCQMKWMSQFLMSGISATWS